MLPEQQQLLDDLAAFADGAASRLECLRSESPCCDAVGDSSSTIGLAGGNSSFGVRERRLKAETVHQQGRMGRDGIIESVIVLDIAKGEMETVINPYPHTVDFAFTKAENGLQVSSPLAENLATYPLS